MPIESLPGFWTLRQIAAAAAGVMLLAAAPAWGDAQASVYQFDVFYNDRPIGEHRWEIVRDGNATRVRSRAALQVKILFVRAYHYEHHANELWRDGCLVALASATDDNGQPFEVAAAHRQGQLELTRREPQRQTHRFDAECPATFAYWDPERLRRDSLINAQTGDAAATTLTREGTETLNSESAVRYRLEVDQAPAITLWYRERDGQWLRLRTQRNDGMLEYRLDSTEERSAPSIDPDAGVESPAVS